MSGYFARHAWGNTTLQDLIDALAAASGRDLDAWRAAWLETAGTDRLTLERDGDRLRAGRPRTRRRAAAARAGGRRLPAPTATDWSVRRSSPVEVRQSRTPVDLPDEADLYLVNDDDLTFATTRPDADQRAALIAAAGELPTAISRGVAVATVWDMLVDRGGHRGRGGATASRACSPSRRRTR